MSMNLTLRDKLSSFSLYQTPSLVTREAMAVYHTGNTGQAAFDHALKTYAAWVTGLDYPRERFKMEHLKELRNFIRMRPEARFEMI